MSFTSPRSLLGLLAAACATDPVPQPTSTSTPTGETGTPIVTTAPEPPITDPLHELPAGAAQWADLCARGHADDVAEAFCEGDAPPALDSLASLRALVGLGGEDAGQPDVLVTAVHHSTALGGRQVTPLNPRTIFFTPPRGVPDPGGERRPDERYTVLAFARGEPVAELISRDPQTGAPRFYLLRFTPPCAASADGCTLADLLLPEIEEGWTGWSLYDDGDLANTTLDCLRCHQPDGPGSPRLLLMQEVGEPWNHWFYEEVPPNLAAIRAFEEAHGDTLYATFPADLYTRTRPRLMQALVLNNNPVDQPNHYASRTINDELDEHGTSPTWDALFAASALGMPAPYRDNPHVDGTWDFTAPYQPLLDPDSPLGEAVTAYRGVADGTLPRSMMPDPLDLWLPGALQDSRHRARPGLDGPTLLAEMCGDCHNSRLDTSLSRARFDVQALATMSREERDLAIERLSMPVEDVRHMPPPRFHTLTDAERTLAIETLRD